LAAVFAVVFFGGRAQSYAGLTIDYSFDSSWNSLSASDRAAAEAAVTAAVNATEAVISSNVTVSIVFQNINTGLGQSQSFFYDVSYNDFYHALAPHMTTPQQQTALNSLGPAPTSPSSPNPVNGGTQIEMSGPIGRLLGFSTSPPPGQPDTIIGLNTSITFPPQINNGANYSLQSVAQHEIDEAIGIGGPGSTLGLYGAGGPVGVLDLYRYSAPGVRNFSTSDPTTTPFSYFSLDGGKTVQAYFNQYPGGDYADWYSVTGPAPGFGPQVQDAFGTPGANPTLGPSELAAFSSVGFQVVPEPSSLALLGAATLVMAGYGWRRSKLQRSVIS
jgi:hypothetical protein